jgi:hypothetical protein
MRHDLQAWQWQVCAMAQAHLSMAAARRCRRHRRALTWAPVAIPGQINAENFDSGGEGVAYHDNSPGNSGGGQAGDVDIGRRRKADTAWMDVNRRMAELPTNVAAGQLRRLIAGSLPGGAASTSASTTPATWKTVSIPATGGWQNWTTVSLTVTLGAGVQQMTLLFGTGAMNFSTRS